MKKIIVLSFLVCIPIFMVAQTFKIVEVNTTFYSVTEKQKILEQLLGEKITADFYKSSIKFRMPGQNKIIIVEKSKEGENFYYAETEYEYISLTISTIFSYVRKASLKIREKSNDTKYFNEKTVKIELERE